MHKNRILKQIIQQFSQKELGRLLVLTGARQTGKTTLVKQAFPDWKYISVEDPIVRPEYSRLSAKEWIENYPKAIIDEVQKVPRLIESVKAAYDEAPHVRYVLLGSSQILLLEKVKESLAGRVVIRELLPLTLPEIATSSWEDPIRESRFVRWIKSDKKDFSIFEGIPAQEGSHAIFKKAWEHYLRFGGMPFLYHAELPEEEKQEWLRNYQQTYLQRDLVDLGNLRDLEPFVLAQKALALRSGKLVNFSDLGRAADISPNTAKKFLRYLELSYQTLVLHPYSRNEEKRLSKSWKIHFLDPGICRGILNKRGEATGEEFESAVVAEIWKQAKSFGIAADFFHLRTVDGKEVDLLIETEEGFLAVEIKLADRVVSSDARSLRGLENILDKPVLARFLLSNDSQIKKFDGGVLALPVPWFLGFA